MRLLQDTMSVELALSVHSARRESVERSMQTGGHDFSRAVQELAVGRFLLAAAHESKRAGVVVSSVQKCSDAPPLICVSVRKGHAIEPLIRDSRHFAVCRLAPGDRTTARHFENRRPLDDPFDSLEIDHLVSRAPVPRRSTLVFDCEVFRHFDLEADHELYVGLVLAFRHGLSGGAVTPPN